MLTRLDHPIIAVRDLEAAMAVYAQLGFSVVVGGRNPGLGTCNALIRFGLEYLELLSVDDRSACLAHHPRGSELLAYLDAQPGGLLSFVVASDALDADLAAARAHGFDLPGEPVAMQRLRPDGTVLRWHLLIPGVRAFRQAWPLLIEWHTPDAQRLAWEPPGVHPNGAMGVTGLVLQVRSVADAVKLYGDQLGLPVQGRTVVLPGCPIELLAGEDVGMCEVRIGVRSPEVARRVVDAVGARLVFEPDAQ
jgi:catechol 2,3-dioxygenase-like lactoylglutathione lyase family enzyme